MITYADAHHAIRDANALNQPAGVAYHQGEGWRVYPLTNGCPEGGVPEFLCFGSGTLPLPLSEPGRQIIRQLLDRGTK